MEAHKTFVSMREAHREAGRINSALRRLRPHRDTYATLGRTVDAEGRTVWVIEYYEAYGDTYLGALCDNGVIR